MARFAVSKLSKVYKFQAVYAIVDQLTARYDYIVYKCILYSLQEKWLGMNDVNGNETRDGTYYLCALVDQVKVSLV
jgi:hypothetical protein